MLGRKDYGMPPGAASSRQGWSVKITTPRLNGTLSSHFNECGAGHAPADQNTSTPHLPISIVSPAFTAF